MARSQRFLIGCSIAAVFVIAGAAAVVVVLLRHVDDLGEAAGQADTASAAYRAAGLPWEAKDLRPKAATVDQVLSVAFQKELARIKSSDMNKSTADVLVNIRAKNLQEATAGLKPYKAALDLAVRASQMPTLNLAIDIDMGAEIRFSALPSLKAIGKGLCIKAQLESAKHDSAGAARDLRAAWQLGRLTGQDPFVLSQLVQCAMQRVVLTTIQSCAYDFRNDSAGLERLGQVIDKPTPPDFAYALKGEAYEGLATIRNLYALGGIRALQDQTGASYRPLDSRHLVRTGLPTDTASRAYATRHMQVWTDAKPLMDQFKGDPAKLGAAMDKLMMSAEKKKSASNVIIKLMSPIFTQVGEALETLEAERAATNALLVALQRRVRTGKLPSSIEEIPGKWIDPFNGEPLKVRNDGDSFRIYSVGPNLEDDRGTFRAELHKQGATNYDVGAAYPPLSR